MTENHGQISGELSRDLRLFHIIMMGLGMMIGAGVFVGIGLSTRAVGPGGLVLTFALNGVVALFTAMSFAELSSAIPRAGGAYNFARIGFGRGASFIAGWMEWFASSLAGAFYAIIFAEFSLEYVIELFGLGLDGWPKLLLIKALALGAAGLFVYINYRGSSETGKVGAIFTVGQMLFVLAIAVAGVIRVALHPQRMTNFTPFMPNGWGPLLGSMGVIYVAFEGFEVIAQAGDETIDPKRNIPKAMLYSVLIVTLTYVGVAFATMVALHPEHVGEGGMSVWVRDFSEISGFRECVKSLLPYGGLLVTLAVIFSSTSALNATIYSATRASYALGRDRMLPGAMAKISPKRKTPYIALAMTSIIVLTAAALLNPKHGAATASIMFLFLFFVVNLCVIKIRLNMGDELEYGYLMPLFPLFPILAILCQLALGWGILGESWQAWLIGVGWVATGVVIFLVYSRKHATRTEDEIHVFEEKRAEVASGTQIMVAVANPGNALEIVRTTVRLCAGREDPHVELLHMVPVPDQVPLSDARQYMLEGREGILETMLYLAPQFPISTHLRYCRNVARGIISAVREKRIEMLILGWHGQGNSGPFHLGSTLDPVIERAPCDVVILKDCGGNREFHRVLVPLAGGPHGAFALEQACNLVEPETGTVTAMTVDTGRRPFDVEGFVRQRLDVGLPLPAGRIHAEVVPGKSVADTILATAADYDLIVLGCTAEPLIRHIARASIPEDVARRSDTPVVMVRASGGLRSWLRRYI